jgi:hypothetical protein
MIEVKFRIFLIFRRRQVDIGRTVYSPVSLTTPKIDTAEQFFGFWVFLTGINDTEEKCYNLCL